MENMYDRKKHRMVQVFSIDAARNVAVTYDPQIASKCPGNGWQEIPLKRLIPEEWVDITIGDFVSKTEKSDAKHRLALCDKVCLKICSYLVPDAVILIHALCLYLADCQGNGSKFYKIVVSTKL